MQETPEEHGVEFEDKTSGAEDTRKEAQEVEDAPETLEEQLALMSPDQRVEFLEGHLVDEGTWIENEIKAIDSDPNRAYLRCPACVYYRQSLQAILQLLQQTLERVDEKRAIERPGLSHELVDMLVVAAKFNFATKATLFTFNQCAHSPQKILSAHPNLKGPTRQRKASPDKKKSRKQRRASRRRSK